MINNKRFSLLKLPYCEVLELLIIGLIIGTMTGLLIAIFRLLLSNIEELRTFMVFSMAERSDALFIFSGIVVLIFFVINKAAKFESGILGSGVSHSFGFLQGTVSMNWARVLILRFIGSLSVIGIGLSVGQEGPSIQLGTAVASGVGDFFGLPEDRTRMILSGGMAAGLAAAFNAPITGVVFVLEEIYGRNTPSLLPVTIVSAIASSFVSGGILSDSMNLHFFHLNRLPLHSYYYAIIVAILISFTGVMYSYILKKLIHIFKNRGIILTNEIVFIPYFAVIILGLFFPDVLGSGHDLIFSTNIMQRTLISLTILLIIKCVFTMICFIARVPGGVFVPTLAIGGLSGNILGIILVSSLGLPKELFSNIIVYAMISYFVFVLKMPVTGILLICELTGGIGDILPYTIVSVISFIISKQYMCESIYKSKIESVNRA